MTSYRLRVFEGDRVLRQGTGWLVSADTVVTAFHVVGEKAANNFFHKGLDNVRYVLDIDNDEHLLTPITFDPRADIALLKLSKSLNGVTVHRLASDDRQEQGVAWNGQGFPGFHNGRRFTLTGKVDARNDWYEKDSLQLHVVQGTQVDWSGVSGTPVIDDVTHAVIGLITEMTSHAATGWGASARAIERVLARYEQRADYQTTSDLGLLYRKWLDVLDQPGVDSSDVPAVLFHHLYGTHPEGDAGLEILARRLLDDAWPDLLITILAAIKNTAPTHLIDEITSRLLGSQHLALHIIWRPQCEQAEKLKDAIFGAFSRPVGDAAAFGLGIPVFLWTEPSLDLLDLNQAQRSLVVVLIDDDMVVSDAWRDELQRLARRIPDDDPRHRLVPCGLTTAAQNLDDQLEERTVLDLPEYDETIREHILIIRLTHRLLNLVRRPNAEDEEKANVFVSYAKSDGRELVQTLRTSLAPYSQGFAEIVVDDTHAVSGRRIKKFIDLIRKSVLVILQTDTYSSREWCNKELLLAKQEGVPILVAVAVDKGEVRSSPYAGNVRTIRLARERPKDSGLWPFVVMKEALRELLSFRLFQKRAVVLEAVGLIKQDMPRDARQPELLTVVQAKWKKGAIKYLHPDPPMSDAEAEILRMAAPQFDAMTPSTLIAQSFPRNAIRVALSISEPETLAQQGLGTLHIHDVWVALTRHLLLYGAQLSYGLDLRAGGFGEIMLRLLEQRINIARYKCKPALSLIAWPMHLTKDVNKSSRTWADFAKVIRQEQIELPPLTRPVDRTKFLPPDSVENLYIWCRSLTHMRERLMDGVDALIAIGGRLSKYKGRYPGVVEEVEIALKRNVPVFLVGGFGGCGNAIAHALKKLPAFELTLDYQTREPGRRELIDYFNREREKDSKSGDTGEAIDYTVLRELFTDKGLLGLGNGLSNSENRRLFVTTSINEIVWLVLKGLSTIRQVKG